MEHVLTPFLEPQKVAVVGVSKTINKPGYIILRNLREFGYTGEVFPVNPMGGNVLGYEVYKSIQDLPDNIDLAVSLIPADETIELLKQCAEKGIMSVLLVSGGFSESGQEGIELQNDVVEFARQNGQRLMGPNAVGPVNTVNNLVLHFYPIEYLKKGGASFVSQSGQFCCPVLEFSNSTLQLGASKSIDLGNCCDIDESDAMEYLVEDPETSVISIYMESIRAGKRFWEVSKEVTTKKPVVVFKTGRTKEGLKTASSHTGAIAVDDTVFDAALKQSGIIRAGELEEFLDFTKTFDYLDLPKGNRVAIITFSGGIGSIVADVCESSGLELAEFSKDTIEKIRPILPPSTKISNPLDCFSAGVVTDIGGVYGVSIKAFMEDENVDIILSCFMVNGIWPIDFSQLADELKPVQTKPLAAWVIGGDDLMRKATRTLDKKRIPVFASPERAIRSLGALWRYSFSSRK